jgi:uncharacterized membrane protein
MLFTYTQDGWLLDVAIVFLKKILQFWQILETDVAHAQLGSSKVVEYSAITDNYNYFDSVITYLIPKCNFLDRRSWTVVMCLC